LLTKYEYENPVLILKTENDFVEYCKNPVYSDNSHDMNKWHVKSVFVIEIINEYAKNKYPYNSNIVEIIKKLYPELNKDIIDLLVYNAQEYRYFDNKINAGYFLLTQEVLDLSYKNKKKIMVNDKICQLVEFDNKIYCKPKYSKNKAYFVYPAKCENDLWAKFVE
jgi:hypothetical protein